MPGFILTVRTVHFLCSLFLTGTWLAMLMVPSAALAETIWIGGSGGASAMARQLAVEFERQFPQHKVIVNPPLSTNGGIKALNAGALDIAVAGRAPTEAESKGRLTAIEFARTPFVLAVAADNPLNDISMSQLAGFYGSSRALWPNGNRVRLVLRSSADIDSKMIESLSGDVAQAHALAQARMGMFIAGDDDEAIHALVRLPGAIGPTTLAQMTSGKYALKALALGGKRPSVEGIRDGSYPYVKRMYLVTSPLSTPAAKQFAAFAQSAAGVRILAALACWTGPFPAR